jgi:hypothetical protein
MDLVGRRLRPEGVGQLLRFGSPPLGDPAPHDPTLLGGAKLLQHRVNPRLPLISVVSIVCHCL